jgi:hypothetical protein
VVQGLLWGAAVIVAVWVLVPAVLYFIGSGRVRGELIEDPAAPEPRADDPVYSKAARAFAEMGFRPAGRLVLKGWFPSPVHWRYESDGPTWMAGDEKMLVTMRYVPGRRTWVTSATTQFAGGGCLQTVSLKSGLGVLVGDKRRLELDNVEPTELVAEHRKHVEAFARERAVPATKTTFEEAGLLLSTNPDLRAKEDWVAGLPFLILLAYGLALYVLLRNLGPYGWMSSLRPVAIFVMAGWFGGLFRLRLPPPPFPKQLGAALFLALYALPILVAPKIPSRETVVWQALDRLDGDIVSGRTAEGLDRATVLDPTACGEVLQRFADARTAWDSRAAFHTLLVRWNGRDLGNEAAAWVSWCNAIRGLK